MTEKIRYPRAAALVVIRELLPYLEPVCERLIVAGSLRRGAAEVGDVEILYIPKSELRQVDLLHSAPADLGAEALVKLLDAGILAKRLKSDGTPTWGEENKLATHVASGIPVDFFTADYSNWFNLLVCRTGPKESNMRISTAAQERGWQWKPYRCGFFCGGKFLAVQSEEDVFRMVGLPYLEPAKR